MVGAQSAPTAAMYENANTNHSGVIRGLYLRSRTSRQAAFGGQSNGLPSSWSSCPLWLIRFASVPSLLLWNRSLRHLRCLTPLTVTAC